MRRLRLQSSDGIHESVFSVVLKASLEVRSAVVFGSLIVVLVLVPVFTLDGLSGAFFKPLALAYVVAILASLAVALTLTPALGPDPAAEGSRAARAGLAARDLAQSALPAVAGAAPGPAAPVSGGESACGVLVALAGLSVPGAGAAAELSRVRLPDALARAAGHVARRDESRDDSCEPRAASESKACAISARTSVVPRLPTRSSASISPSSGSAWIRRCRTRRRSRSPGDRRRLSGAVSRLLTYLRERIKEVLTGTSGAVVVRIFGPDLERLRGQGDEARRAVAAIDGVDDLHVQHQTLIPQIGSISSPRRRPRSALRRAIYAASPR